MMEVDPDVTMHKQSEPIEFLQALNAAAAAVQRVARSETAVYQAFSEQLIKLGIYGAVSMLDESGDTLSITAVVLSEAQNKKLDRLLKIAKFSPIGYQYKVDAVPIIQQTIKTAKAHYVSDNKEVILNGLSAYTKPIVNRFIKYFGTKPAVLAPIFGDAAVMGVIYLSGESLTEQDLPAVSALVNHLSIALENARLFHSLQNETELIRKREEQFRLLAENVPGVIYLCENNYHFDMIYLNDAVETLTGYPKEMFTSKEISFRDLYHPDDSENIKAESEDRYRDLGTFHHIYRIQHRSGAWRWVEEFGKSVFDDNGRMLFLEGSITDITERRQAEILQSTLYRIATVSNADLTLTQMYAAIHAILGDLMDVGNFYIALVEEETGLLTLPYFVDEMDTHDGQPFDGSGGLTDYLIHVGQPQLLSRFEIKQLLKKGLLRPLGSMPEVWLGVPLRTQAHVFGAIVVQSYQDATAYTEREKQLLFFVSGQVSASIERKRSEEQLRQMAEEIQIQSRMFEEILSTTPDQFVVYDLQGRIIFASNFVAQFFGQSRDTLMGKTMDDVALYLPPDLVEQSHKERQEVIRTGEPLRGEVKISIDAGSSMDVEYILSPIKDDDGRVTAVVSSSRDITDRNKTKAALHHAQKLESLAILSGGVAHDFNNLLVGMMAQTSLARAKLAPDSPVLRHIEKAETAADRAALLTKQLLAYSGQGQFTIQPVNLNSLIKSNQQLFHAALSSHVQLQFDLTPDLPAIAGDSTQLLQMLMNLILNGNEAIGDEAGIISVASKVCFISAEGLEDWTLLEGSHSSGHYVCLEVHDNGEGIDQETMGRIFEPFFTTKFTGRGLGLAAVSGIVRGHKGGLRVKSQPETGTLFEIIFEPAEAFQTTAVAQPEADPTTGYILVIDDEQPVREAVMDILDLEGLAGLTAVDGQSGIDLYQARWPEISLVLLDISLPDMRGEEVYVKLKETNPNVQVILSSGFSEGEALKGIDGDPVDFLRKPYSLDQFLEIVTERLQPA